jgi:N-acetylneuraminic acid mutarotase
LRTEVAAASLAGKIYVAGGLTADRKASRVVEVYDPDSNSWSSSVSLPVALHHLGLVSVGSRLYVIGGYLDDGLASRHVWTWTVGDDRWQAEPDMPTARGALAVAAHEHDDGPRLHAVGGATRFGPGAKLTGAHEVYDPTRRRWTKQPDLPDARDHLAAAAIGWKIYVIGGRELSVQRNQARVDVFDAKFKTWRRAPDMPTARGGLAAAAAGGRLYVFGGEQRSGTFAQAQMFDARRGRWSELEPLPTARHGLGAAVLGDRIYIVGGGPAPGLSVSGTNEILRIGR